MEKKEFDKLVGITTAPECYERIEHVYMNSDLFNNKQQIADFYKANDMAGIERVYKGILAHREAIENLENEVGALKAEITTIQRPVVPVKISDELVNDLAIFSETYVERIRIAIIQNAGQIAKDPTIIHLLHEYAIRKQQERTDYARDVMNAIKGMEFRPSNNCLTHTGSYRDVIDDLLRPYWEGRAAL